MVISAFLQTTIHLVNSAHVLSLPYQSPHHRNQNLKRSRFNSTMHLTINTTGTKNGQPEPDNEKYDSACSTPFVSAPSSPARCGGGGVAPSGYFFSAPASPVHYVLSSSSSYREKKEKLDGDGLTDFEFSARSGVCEINGSGAMSSADELFLDGKIRPMDLSSHLQTPQLDLDDDDCGEDTVVMMRGRELRLRNRSMHRQTRSLSPLRNLRLDEIQVEEEKQEDVNVDERMEDTDAAEMTSSSRSTSTGSRNSKKWIFLKDLLYRSKSEGQGRASTKDKFWSSISFSPGKDKKSVSSVIASEVKSNEKCSKKTQSQRMGGTGSVRKAVNGSVSMRRGPAPSAHELHYTANRAQAEEMKRKTYLPYRQGLFGCLGFSSKGYGLLHGFTKTLNPVSSR